MSKGKYAKRSTRKILIWLLLFLFILFCITVYLAYDLSKRKDPNNIHQTTPVNAETNFNETDNSACIDVNNFTQPGVTIVQTEVMPTEEQEQPSETHQTEIASTEGQEQPSETHQTEIAPTEEQEQPSETHQTEIAPTEEQEQPSETHQTEIAPTEEQEQPSETYQTEVPETLPPAVTEQQADAEYERWLASALVVGISMEYPDFIPNGVYSASATNLEDKFSSDGVYVIFASNGTIMAIHSKPISSERTEPGTKDISSETIGFATFDFVDPTSINVDSMDRMELEDLGELIAQSLLISIYTH